MKKSDLKTGHIVELKSGGVYVVLRDACKGQFNPSSVQGGVLVNNNLSMLYLTSYSENMKNNVFNGFDIVAVYKPDLLSDTVRFTGDTKGRKEIWRRPKPVKKTVAELVAAYEAAHNCQVEVVES